MVPSLRHSSRTNYCNSYNNSSSNHNHFTVPAARAASWSGRKSPRSASRARPMPRRLRSSSRSCASSGAAPAVHRYGPFGVIANVQHLHSLSLSLSLSLCVEPRAMGRRRTRGMVEQARTRAVVHGVGGARDPTRGDAAARAAGLDRVLPRADRCRTQAAGGHRARPPLVPRGTRNLGRHGARDTIDLGPAHRVGAVDRGERLILPSLICRYRYLCCIADCAFALSICPTYLSLSLSFSHMKSSRLL